MASHLQEPKRGILSYEGARECMHVKRWKILSIAAPEVFSCVGMLHDSISAVPGSLPMLM